MAQIYEERFKLESELYLVNEFTHKYLMKAMLSVGWRDLLEIHHCCLCVPIGFTLATSNVLALVSPNAERICDAIDVVEPRSDECDLQDSLVVETDGAQALVIFACDARGVFRQLHDVVEHCAILI